MIPVSVIIVSFNTRDLLLQCLSAIEPHHQVIVVDNASSDGSADRVVAEFPQVVIIRNTKNRGFGAANNQGMDVATLDRILLLNSDACPMPGAIDRLAAALDDPGVAACGGRLQFADGRLQESACRELTLWAVFCEQTFLEKLVPRSKLFNGYWVSSRLPNGGEVEQVMGACLMMRPGERFDERFFLYCEDTELCKRLRHNGRILYEPNAVFVHALGASSIAERWRSVVYYNRGKELYFALHRGPIAAAACWSINRFGALLRIFAGGLVGPKARTFWRVLLAPINPYPR
jgi:GT2 family glycosyltransferase